MASFVKLARLCRNYTTSWDLYRAVIWRKKCFKTDSEAGSRFVAHILTVVTTMDLQRRPIFEVLVQVREVAVRGSEPPSLCPTT